MRLVLRYETTNVAPSTCQTAIRLPIVVHKMSRQIGLLDLSMICFAVSLFKNEYGLTVSTNSWIIWFFRFE